MRPPRLSPGPSIPAGKTALVLLAALLTFLVCGLIPSTRPARAADGILVRAPSAPGAAAREDDAKNSAAKSGADNNAESPTKTGELIAIGDVHGDAHALVEMLLALKLVDTNGSWSGGKRHLLLTGDLVDRGDHSRLVVEFVRRLSSEAATAGGRVIVLSGNHEIMALLGDTQSVSAADFAQFVDADSAALREKRRRELLARIRLGSPLLRSDYYLGLARILNERSFDRAFPRGYFTHRARLGPKGDLGKWLLTLPVAHRENDTLFVHGGISPRLARLPVDELNAAARVELRAFLDIVEELERREVFDADLGLQELFLLLSSERAVGGPAPEIRPLFRRLEELSRGIILGEDGPMWYRGLAEDREALLRPTLEKILETHSVKRVVIGHTQPVSKRVETRFDDRVYLIDTGLNRAVYNGVPSALRLLPSGEVSIVETPR